MPRALLSVSDKTAWRTLRGSLCGRGFELVSTGGTARALADAGLPVEAVSGGDRLPRDARRSGEDAPPRHPRRHPRPPRPAGRPRRRSPAHGIRPIDLVVVNLYPFEKAAADAATPFEPLVEEIDIGGPSLVRAAAKNFRDVLVVVSPADYARCIEELDRRGRGRRTSSALPWLAGPSPTPRPTTPPSRLELDKVGSRRRMFRRSGGCGRAARRSCSCACTRCATCATARTRTSRRRGTAPARGAGGLSVTAGQGAVVHQPARRRFRRRASPPNSTNRPLSSSSTPTRAAPRPGATLADAYVRARDADPLAAFGGIVGLNRPTRRRDGARDGRRRSSKRSSRRRERGGGRDPGREEEHAGRGR